MLKIARLERSQDRVQILKAFDPATDRWIVSDLRSKLEIQKDLLRRFGGLAGDPVLRSSELWGKIFQRKFPELEILQDEWFSLFARRFLGAEMEKNKISSAVDLMHVFVPIFLHPERQEILRDVLSKDESAMGRWGDLLEPAIRIYNEAHARGWVSRSWIPALLESEGLGGEGDGKRYIFDLGASLSSSEAELIHQLSQNCEVLTLLPRPEKIWRRFDYLLQPGELLAAKATGMAELSSAAAPESRRDFLRFSGRVAEIKEAVAQVREWLDAGVLPERIAIITPNFEMDFPVLEEHFKVEGVPLDRASSRRVQTHRALQKWTARLRLWREDLRFSDLLTSFHDGTPLRSEKFEALFKKSAFAADLARSPAIAGEAAGFFPPDAAAKYLEMSLPDFFNQASKLWEEREFQDLERIFESVSEATPAEAKLNFGDWIEWTELQLSRLEINPIDEGGERLAITSLQNADSMAWTHRIFLSLVDQLPERRGLALLTGDEVQHLGWSYGFFLPHPEQTLLQFELEWLLGEGRGFGGDPGHDIFSYPVTDWKGKPTAPQPFVLQGLGDDHTVRTPKLSRWDELQRATSAPAERDTSPLPWTENLNLSASSIGRYLKCPFIFKAEKVFGLQDPAVVDLELDARERGSLVHELFDRLLEAPIQWDRSVDDIATLLDQLRASSTDFYLDEALWAPMRRKWALTGYRFLQKEREFFGRFPKLEVLGREQAFHVAYDPATKTWRAGDRQNPQEVLFRGKIDRIDGIKDGGIVLYDYKSTVKSEHGFTNWLKDDELQMAFYSWLAEEGFVDPSWRGRVLGGIYYSIKVLERAKGFQHPDGVGHLFDKVEPAKFEELTLDGVWQKTRERIEEATAGILAGHFEPVPVDTNICKTCRWRGLCRAPHLTL